jgi:CHASE2 domain-containing sensor protein/signal transduction histidine kinase
VVWRLLPGGLVALVLASLSQAGLLIQFEQLTYNLLFQLRGGQAWDDRIVLVAIDDTSLQQLGRYPWDRSRFVQLQQQLAQAEPSVVAYDLIFSESARVDSAFATAIDQSIPVILAQATTLNGLPLAPQPSLATAAAAVGHIDRHVDADGGTRQIALNHQDLPSLSLAAVQAHGLSQPIPPLPQSGPLWLNWPSRGSRMPTYSFSDVLSRRVPATAFKEKIVLVGMTATGFDTLPTPFDRNPPVTGIYLHATAIHNLLRQNGLIKIAHPWLTYGLLLVMPLFGWFLSYWRTDAQFYLGVGLSALWGVAAVLGLHGGYWLPITLPTSLLLGTTFSVSLIERLRMHHQLQSQLQQISAHYLPPPATPAPLLARVREWPAAQPASLALVNQLTALARQLGQAQATQLAIAQSLSVGIVAIAATDGGTVAFCNANASRWLPITVGDRLASALVPNWISQDAWNQILARLEQTTISLTAATEHLGANLVVDPWQQEYEVQHQSRWYWLQFVMLQFPAQPMASNGAMPTALIPAPNIVLLIEDITTRKQLETNLGQQVQELQWLIKLKDELIGRVSHELRSPIANMLLSIELLRTARNTSEHERQLQLLETECLRERNFINDFLSLQLSQPPSPVVAAPAIELIIGPWLHEILHPFQARAATRQQRIQIDCAEHLPPLRTDLGSLERICKELVTNACKYTPAGETIAVQVRTEADQLVISVKNFGVEIPSSELTRIFEKFYRIPAADPWNQGGTGMGLAIVQRLATQMGATIVAQSGAGYAEFCLRLPIVAQR